MKWSSCVVPGKPNLPFELRGRAGGCARVTAGQKKPHVLFCLRWVLVVACGILFPDQGLNLAWWAAVHGVAKSRARLSDFTFTFHFHALEKEMATLSSILAWRIPGTGEPGGLRSMGSHGVGQQNISVSQS